MGRRSKLEEFSDGEKATLLKLLRVGNFRVTACAAVGITQQTLRNWQERARAGEEKFAEFMDEVERAEAQAEIDTVNVIAMCARGELPKDKDGNVIPKDVRTFRDWKAAAFILERRGARRWAPMQRKVTGKGGEAPVPSTPSPEAAAAIVRQRFGDHARRPLQEDPDEGVESKSNAQGSRS